MSLLEEEVQPGAMTRILGHICGACFVLLASFIAWMIYRFFFVFSLTGLLLLLFCLPLCVFFYLVSARLTSRKRYKTLISKSMAMLLVVLLVYITLICWWLTIGLIVSARSNLAFATSASLFTASLTALSWYFVKRYSKTG